MVEGGGDTEHGEFQLKKVTGGKWISAGKRTSEVDTGPVETFIFLPNFP